MRPLLPLAFALMLAAAAPASAQSQPPPNPAWPAQRDAGIRSALAKAPDITDGIGVSSTGARVVLEATVKDKVATARIAQVWNQLRIEGQFRGKVSEGADSTELADLDGVRNKTSFKGSVMWTYWGQGDPAAFLRVPCENYRATGQAKNRVAITEELEAELRLQIEKEFPITVRNDPSFPQTAKAREAELRKELPGRVEKKVAAAPVICTIKILTQEAESTLGRAKPGSPDAKRAQAELDHLRTLLPPETVWFVGGDFTFAPEEFEFVTIGDAVVEDKARRVSKSVLGRVSVLTKHNVTYSLGAGWEKSYKAAAETEVCTPAGPTDVQKCSTVAVGGPTDKERYKAVFSIRWFPNPKFALDFRVTRDLKNKQTGYEFPMYFLQSPDGGLAGGVNIGYRPDKRAVTAVLFVGGLTTLLPK